MQKWIPYYFLVVTIVLLITGYLSSRIFPKISKVHVLFRERFLTGRAGSLGSFRNTLEVILTDQELWLRSFLPFNGVLAATKALHKVPLSAIRKIETRGKETTIYLINKKGKEAYFTVRFRKTSDFIQVIQQLNKSVKVLSIH